jgi:hypothetical protein
VIAKRLGQIPLNWLGIGGLITIGRTQLAVIIRQQADFLAQ